MYWKAIGTSVRAVFEHTYLYNRLWGHPIFPSARPTKRPGAGPLQLFRRFAASYGGLPPSWWDWQETTGSGVGGARRHQRLAAGDRLPPSFTQPLLKRGSKGDLVVWAQEHLLAAGEDIPVNGIFGKADDRRRARLPGSATASRSTARSAPTPGSRC